MQSVAISGNGTTVFELQPGRWRMDLEGTRDAGCSIALNAGSDSTGTNHVAVPDQFGVDVVWSGATNRVPVVIEGAGPYSLVTTGFGSSSGLQFVFRKSASS